MHSAALVSLATSVPAHTFLQKDVLAAAWDIFGSRFPDYERFASIYTNTGIIKRHGVKPFDWYLSRAAGRNAPRRFSKERKRSSSRWLERRWQAPAYAQPMSIRW